MSAHEKDPLEKQDTPSESSSSDSHSDSEVEKAEENLENLKIGDLQAKEAKKDCKETKSLGLPTQQGTLTAKHELTSQPVAGPSGQPVAGPSGLQEPSLSYSSSISERNPQRVRQVAQDIDEGISSEVTEGDSETTRTSQVHIFSPSTSDSAPGFKKLKNPAKSKSTILDQFINPLCQSDASWANEPDEESRILGCEPPSDLEYERLPIRDVVARFMQRNPDSSSSRRLQYAADSANTSSDISEIRSEIADISTETSVYQDAPENFEKEESPAFVSALERQSSEASDSNISDLQYDYLPPLPSLASTSTSTSSGERILRSYSEQDSDMRELLDDSAPRQTSSVSVSTNTGDQGHQAYLARLEREAEELGRPKSTSSGIWSTDRSELANLQAWGAAGEAGSYRRNDEDVINFPSLDEGEIGAVGGDLESTGKSMEKRILRDRQIQVSEQEQQQPANLEDPNAPKATMSGCAANIQEASPSKRRRFSKCSSDSSREEGIAERLRPRYRPDSGKKSKSLPSKQSRAAHSSSGSPEPKSSSSDELFRKDSPEIKSSSKSRESSPSEKGRKPWQKSGLLRSRQIATMSSKDSVIVEEDEDRTSSKDQGTESMVTKRAAPKQMETGTEKSAEEDSASAEQSCSRLPTESGVQTCLPGTELPLMEVESFEVPEFERSVGKSKRQQKLSNSLPSDEMLGSSPPSVSTAAEAAPVSRPKKKSRPDKLPEQTRRTRHDSGGSPPKSVGIGNLQQSKSTSSSDTSDYTLSDEEKETAL